MNYGAGKWERIKIVKNMSFTTIEIMGIIFSSSGILYPKFICSIFMNLDQEMTSSAQKLYACIFLPFSQWE